MNYIQIFQFVCDFFGQYFVFNDIFKFVYGQMDEVIVMINGYGQFENWC